MTESNRIALFLPGQEPQFFDLDKFRTKSSGAKAEQCVVRFGRGPLHGKDDRAPPNDIAIDPDMRLVSRSQCIFQYDHGSWFLTDDQSQNGMIFQGRKIQTRELHDGDKIYIGRDESQRVVMLFLSQKSEKHERMARYFLDGKEQVMIGREASCGIVIPHPSVSRRHCLLAKENGVWYISDNNSTNGVLLNGRLLEKKEPLQELDLITIVDTTLFFSGGCLYSSRPEGGVSLSAEQLFKKVGKKGAEKFITNDVSLSIQPDEFVAIVGGSGAGKTTLLDCLSGMTGFTSGEILINGESIRSAGKSLQSLMGYVPQQDIVYDMLTLEQMLYYSAQLRMPKDTTREEIQAKIDETLAIVELTEHRETMISKLSGGQRKRASIAVELLAEPKLFFLDEPSSGLDPGTEKHLMQMLKNLSKSGKTVIMVTHTVQNIDLCDRLICMGKGGLLCYAGPPSEAMEFFGKERLTDIYDDLNENAEPMSQKWKARMAGAASGDTAVMEENQGRTLSRRGFSTLFRQFRVMTLRYAEILKNSLPRLLLLLLMPVVLTLLVCIAFQADGGLYKTLSLQHVRETFPFLVAKDTMSLISAFSCAAFWIGIFNSIQEISKERSIYEREKFTGVAVMPYLLSKFVMLTLLCVIQAAVMTELLWLMSNTVATVDVTRTVVTDMPFRMTTDGVVFSGGMFWVELFLTTFFCCLSAMCLGLTISSLVSNDMALVLCPICLLPQILFSGVATKLTGVTNLISRIIPCRWSCIGLLTSVNVNDMYIGYEFKTKWAPTDDGTLYTDAAYSADKVYVFGQNPVVSSWIALGLIALACLILAYLILRFRRRQTR